MTAWAKLLISAALLGGVAWGAHLLVQHGDAAGYARAAAEGEKRERAIEKQVDAKYAQALATAATRLSNLQDDLNDLSVVRHQEKSDAAKNLEKAVAAAVARTERLSIRTAGTSCPVPGSGTGADPGPAGGPGSEARADLLPETAVAIFGIAADSAGLVRDYNDVVKRYELARLTCNAK